MLFNDTTGEQGIVQDIDFHCHTNSATYSLANKARNINNWYDLCAEEIVDAMDEWDFQGEIATANLSANQQEYRWPSDIIKPKRVEVDYDGDGEYVVAKPLDISTIEASVATSAEINDMYDEDAPFYALFDDSLFLLPVPDTDRTSGLKIWYLKNVPSFSAMASWSALSNSATFVGNSGEPNFHKSFHRILSLGPTLDYARRWKIKEIIDYATKELYGDIATRSGKIGGLIDKMKRFYSTRAGDKILSFKSGYINENYE